MSRAPVLAVIGLSGKTVFMQAPRLWTPGETSVAFSHRIEYGGKGFNQAVAAAKWGAEVHFLTALGKDEEGRACICALEKAGVCVHPVLKDAPTAFAVVLTDNAGENAVTVYRGAANLLSERDAAEFGNILAGCDMLLLQGEAPAATTLAALEAAEKCCVPVLLNPAPPHGIEREHLRSATYVIPNEYEYLVLKEKLSEGTVIVTRGKEGAELLGTEGKRLCSLCVPAVDTTGAGDVFCAAFAFFKAKGEPVVRCIKKAIAASGLKVGRRGVYASIPTADEIEREFERAEESGLWNR